MGRINEINSSSSRDGQGGMGAKMGECRGPGWMTDRPSQFKGHVQRLRLILIVATSSVDKRQIDCLFARGHQMPHVLLCVKSGQPIVRATTQTQRRVQNVLPSPEAKAPADPKMASLPSCGLPCLPFPLSPQFYRLLQHFRTSLLLLLMANCANHVRQQRRRVGRSVHATCTATTRPFAPQPILFACFSLLSSFFSTMFVVAGLISSSTLWMARIGHFPRIARSSGPTSL